jgi:hypothetical protein
MISLRKRGKLPRWEYLHVASSLIAPGVYSHKANSRELPDLATHIIVEALNAFGDAGWEVVSAEWGSGRSTSSAAVFLLKRPKP